MPINEDLMNIMGAGSIQSPNQLTTGNVKPTDWNLISMMLGQAGQAFSAQEPKSWQHQLGGVASGLAASKKMAGVAEKQGAERRKNWEMIRDMMKGGMTPMGMPGITRAELAGGKGGGLPEFKMSITPEAEGMENLFGMSPEPLSMGGMTPGRGAGGGSLDVGMPTAGGMNYEQFMKANQPSQQRGMIDISPFSESPSGLSAADLVGLAPEQILAVMGEQRALDQMKAGTFINAINAMQKWAPKPIEQFETFSDERGRIFRRNLTTNELEQVSGVPTEAPLTYEQKAALKKIPTDIARGDYWKNPKTNDTQWVDFGENPPAGYTQRVPRASEREVSDLPERRFGLTIDQATTRAAENIRLNPKEEYTKPDIEFYNRNATGSTGYFWRSEVVKWGKDIKEATEINLPIVRGKQLTMERIREIAKNDSVTPEYVLEQIWKEMQRIRNIK